MAVELRTFTSGGMRIVYDPQHLAEPVAQWFGTEGLLERPATRALAEGRGAAIRFVCGELEYVLRHYRRGGAVAPVLGDRYLRSPWQPPRPVREANLLLLLREYGLPVPEVVAWRVEHAGLFYRADLITAWVPTAFALTTQLARAPLDAPAWRRLGHVLRTFHDRQVWHADLSLGNILLDAKGQFHLIDFDRARIRAGSAWKERNLKRLLRSCCKQAGLREPFYFCDADFTALREGYDASSS